ncbi:MAG TPA: hypothetical protein VGJ45_19135, partial [Pseudonocardiaceae bacterium]
MLAALIDNFPVADGPPDNRRPLGPGDRAARHERRFDRPDRDGHRVLVERDHGRNAEGPQLMGGS